MVTKKETIKPPSAANVKTAAKQLPAGGKASGPAGRVLADKSVAVKQGAVKPAPKRK